MSSPAAPIDRVIDELQRRIEELPVELTHRRTFIATYRRTTIAIAEEIAAAGFEDPDWVARWDVAFADLFLVAHDADRAGQPVPRPWRLTFGADAEMHDLAHLLLGMNAHINFDLPQSLLAVISPADFDDPVLLARRDRDHTRIDRVLARRVSAEISSSAAYAVGATGRWRRSTARRPAGSSPRPGARCGGTPSSCTAPGSPGPRRTRPGWPSSKCCRRPRSPTW